MRRLAEIVDARSHRCSRRQMKPSLSAVSRDFGHRSAEETSIAEMFGAVNAFATPRRKVKNGCSPRSIGDGAPTRGTCGIYSPRRGGVRSMELPIMCVFGGARRYSRAGKRASSSRLNSRRDLCVTRSDDRRDIPPEWKCDGEG